ncbi:hypothetical protein TcYC6_0051400 [Trypanosoma cruzi]|nr:hypothetical protein TcYC6_0051400 [Trypanosoma cruzi]
MALALQQEILVAARPRLWHPDATVSLEVLVRVGKKCLGGARLPGSGASSVCDLRRPPPSCIDGVATDETYGVTKELRRQIDGSATHQDIKAMLKKEPSVLLAVARVLPEPALP